MQVKRNRTAVDQDASELASLIADAKAMQSELSAFHDRNAKRVARLNQLAAESPVVGEVHHRGEIYKYTATGWAADWLDEPLRLTGELAEILSDVPADFAAEVQRHCKEQEERHPVTSGQSQEERARVFVENVELFLLEIGQDREMLQRRALAIAESYGEPALAMDRAESMLPDTRENYAYSFLVMYGNDAQELAEPRIPQQHELDMKWRERVLVDAKREAREARRASA